MAKKKKNLVDIEIICPVCEGKLQVGISRKRLNPTVLPEYEYTTIVEEVKQEELFPKPKGRRAKVEAA